MPESQPGQVLKERERNMSDAADAPRSVSYGFRLGLCQRQKLRERLSWHGGVHVQDPGMLDVQAHAGKVTIDVVVRTVEKPRMRRQIADYARAQGITIRGGFCDHADADQSTATGTILHDHGHAQLG